MWSITKNQELYEVSHNDWVRHVRLFPDSKLGFDLITCSDDKTVKFWRRGKIFKTLEHSNYCWRFDLDKTNRLLAVGTKDGVTVWQMNNFSKVGEENIGDTRDVRFNKDSTKVLAVKESGEVYKISLQ